MTKAEDFRIVFKSDLHRELADGLSLHFAAEPQSRDQEGRA